MLSLFGVWCLLNVWFRRGMGREGVEGGEGKEERKFESEQITINTGSLILSFIMKMNPVSFLLH